jgi:pimeloyl-ACP methyl ester carboxylesterase
MYRWEDTMSGIIIDGGKVNYAVHGRGRSILFVHGWFGPWRYWWPVMDALAARARSYALDLWGFGGSDRIRERYSVGAYAILVRELVDRLGILQVAVVGHDLGAAVAIELASTEPQRVTELVVVGVPLSDGVLNHRSVSSERARRRHAPEDYKVESSKVDPEVVPQTLKSMRGLDLQGGLRKLKCPVLAIHGSEDAIVDGAEVQALGGEGHIRVEVLADAGHFPMTEASARFSALLQEFLFKERA